MGTTLLKKVWDLHTVRQLPTGQTQLFIGLHLVHEVTSPQAFDELRAQRLEGRAPGSHIRHRRSHRADESADAPVHRRDGRRHDGLARAQRARVRSSLCWSRRRSAGHRARDRTGARTDAARHDDRVRRQPHLDTRRVRRGRVRHRHVAGTRRARLAVPGARAAQGAPHPRDRRAAERRLREGRHPCNHPAARRAEVATATPTSTPATSSIACRWTSA